MNTLDLNLTISVDQSPQQAFGAINNVRGWWSEEIQGDTKNLHDEFNYHYEDVHRCKIKLIEVIPDKKIVWQVLENHFKFTQDKSEWTGTTISFEIAEKNNKTEIRFTHHGLTPAYECYEICSNAWTQYFQGSLKSLITTGTGLPNSIKNPRTEDEKKLKQK